jgi:predicted XRE-type DNA-binding protein
MRIRRDLFDLVLRIAKRDHLSAGDIAHMCGTSRPRAWRLLAGRIEQFNSETLIDILFRVGVSTGIEVTGTRAYRRMEFDNPRVARRFIEPWRD